MQRDPKQTAKATQEFVKAKKIGYTSMAKSTTWCQPSTARFSFLLSAEILVYLVIFKPLKCQYFPELLMQYFCYTPPFEATSLHFNHNLNMWFKNPPWWCTEANLQRFYYCPNVYGFNCLFSWTAYLITLLLCLKIKGNKGKSVWKYIFTLTLLRYFFSMLAPSKWELKKTRTVAQSSLKTIKLELLSISWH